MLSNLTFLEEASWRTWICFVIENTHLELLNEGKKWTRKKIYDTFIFNIMKTVIMGSKPNKDVKKTTHSVSPKWEINRLCLATYPHGHLRKHLLDWISRKLCQKNLVLRNSPWNIYSSKLALPLARKGDFGENDDGLGQSSYTHENRPGTWRFSSRFSTIHSSSPISIHIHTSSQRQEAQICFCILFFFYYFLGGTPIMFQAPWSTIRRWNRLSLCFHSPAHS